MVLQVNGAAPLARPAPDTGKLVPMHLAAYPDIPDDFGHWLAGLADGEGCFYLGWIQGRAGAVVTFHITLRADDRVVLNWIREVTGIGGITSWERIDRSPQVRWTVFRKQECHRLVEIFDAHPLRAKKARDFAIWREAVKYHASIGRKGRTAPDWEPMRKLATELRRVREYDADQDPLFLDDLEADDHQIALFGSADG